MMYFLVIVSLFAVSAAFSSTSLRVSKLPIRSPTLFASPTSDGDEGYGPIGSLIRQGPVPFLIRIVKPSTYNAAVEKYMALEKVDKITAMANMDAYFQDPNGWAGNKLRERNGGVKVDYVNMNQQPGELALTGVWAVGIISLFIRLFQVQVLDK